MFARGRSRSQRSRWKTGKLFCHGSATEILVWMNLQTFAVRVRVEVATDATFIEYSGPGNNVIAVNKTSDDTPCWGFGPASVLTVVALNGLS